LKQREQKVRRSDKNTDPVQIKAVSSLLKTRDPDRYWTVLFAPRQAQASLFALYAFHSELEHISRLISEPMVGQIRLQWWRDAIELAAPGAKTGNPVADALADAILTHHLPKSSLQRLVDARLPEIYRDPPADIQALRTTLKETTGTVFELAAAILGFSGETISKASAHAGVAEGLTRILLTLPMQASRQSLLIPPSYLESRAVDLRAVYRGKSSAALKAALADLRGAAAKALHAARVELTEVHGDALPGFLPLAVVKPYLKAMAAPDYNPLQAVATVNPLRRFWRIWRASRRGRL
jgi:phytoene synthase